SKPAMQRPSRSTSVRSQFDTSSEELSTLKRLKVCRISHACTNCGTSRTRPSDSINRRSTSENSALGQSIPARWKPGRAALTSYGYAGDKRKLRDRKEPPASEL